MTVKASIQTGTSVTLGAAGGPTIAYGTGAPSTTKITGSSTSANGTPAVGSQYIRTDGASGSRVYWYFSGAWTAQTSP